MKKLFTILCSIFVGTQAFAQLVPNGDFETAITNWKSVNTTLVNSVTVNGPGGSETLLPAGGLKMAIMQSAASTAVLSQKFAYTQRPNSFRFMFCYLPAGAGEIGFAQVRLTKFNTTTSKVDTLLALGIVMNGQTYPWKEAIIELSDKYKMTGNPDTASVIFYNSAGSVHLQGTALILDNIKFSANSATIKEIDNTLVGNPAISPNPVSSNATISYQINSTSNVKIELYDMTGKMVKEILNENNVGNGKYNVDLDVSDINSGLYFYKVSTGAYSTTEKIIISK